MAMAFCALRQCRRKKPASVLFDRIARRGKPLAVEELQGLAVAKQQGKA